MKKKLIEFFNSKCITKSCSDEVVGGFAILIGISAYFVQFFFSEQSLDVSSFSIIALFLSLITEGLFAVQGYLKGSFTILLTRILTFIGFFAFIILWFLDHNKQNNEELDD